MTYEEKLEKVISKLQEERELTRRGHVTKVTFNDHSFTKVRVGEICKILLKLQDEEQVLKIVDAYQPVDTLDPYEKIKDENYDDVKVIVVELMEIFDGWYEDYLLKQKSRVTNLDYKNLS